MQLHVHAVYDKPSRGVITLARLSVFSHAIRRLWYENIKEQISYLINQTHHTSGL